MGTSGPALKIVLSDLFACSRTDHTVVRELFDLFLFCRLLSGLRCLLPAFRLFFGFVSSG